MFSNCYLPQPPRDWSRVQNSCSLDTTISTNINGLEKMNMLQKGNILQYKKNSSNLTINQKYSLIAQGKWVNRNITWATQSTRGYTNPNNTHLKRVQHIDVAFDPITRLLIGVTSAPPTCITPISIINNVLPPNGSNSSLNPSILPPPPPINPTHTGTNLPPTPTPIPIPPFVIQDEGILVCNVIENICTGETITTLPQQLCNPTSDSDVPGTIQSLCWNDGTPTWYPRQRYVMTNSTNKWPVNATLFSAIKLPPPIIISLTNNNSLITINWYSHIPINTFTIFQNNIPIQIVNGSTFSTTVLGMVGTLYTFYIIGENRDVKSEPSKSVSMLLK
jgi:hypothetical protein